MIAGYDSPSSTYPVINLMVIAIRSCWPGEHVTISSEKSILSKLNSAINLIKKSKKKSKI